MMADVAIVDLGRDDIMLMAEKMRPMDVLEYRAMSNGAPVEVGMELVWKTSDLGKAAYLDGELLCCWGRYRQTILSAECNPWMVATPLVETQKARRFFLRNSKAMTRDLVGDFSRAWNLVYEGNKRTIRWLKWVGFELVGEPVMAGGYRFLPFEFRKD